MRNKLSNIKIWLLAGASLTLGACEKFLDEAPNKSSSVVVSSLADLDGLLNDANTSGGVNNYVHDGTRNYQSSDDFGLTPDLWTKTPLVGSLFYGLQDTWYATWDRDLTLDLNDGGWTLEYRKIFTANLVLSELDRVNGSQAEKDRLRADAHFVRAYSYWWLANTYCLPYTEANKNEPGLVLKRSTSFEEGNARATLEETYAQIDADLAEAMKITLPPVQEGKLRNWRTNTAAVHAFAARYALQQNDYQKALTEANASLAIHSELTDYNNEAEVYFPESGIATYPYNTGSTDPANPPGVLTVKVSSLGGVNLPGYREILFLRLKPVGVGWCPPSQALIDLYGTATTQSDVSSRENDLRWSHRYILGQPIRFGFSTPAQLWPSYNGYGVGGLNNVINGLTVPEVILIKAEAQARLDQVSEAMNTVNSLRVKRIASSAGAARINLTAANKGQAIAQILDERRREMPFAARWFDLRRLNNNEDPNDDVVPTKTFFEYNISTVLTSGPVKTYTLEKNSRKYAMPIPVGDIQASNGALLQNTY